MFPYSFDIRPTDTPFDPNSRDRIIRTRVNSATGNRLYLVYLYLTGQDVPFVKQVVYELHPSLTNHRPIVIRTDMNPYCVWQMWLWGTFPITAFVTSIENQTVALPYHLQFNSYFGDEIRKKERIRVVQG
ncbi:MAG: hypothetical protein HY291_23375 [Planctomycetes bacterium]|nr:hypothetical protein [Planctomycetota bacterium]